VGSIDLQFEVLGPIGCLSNRRRLDVGDPRLLALLLVHANQTVPDEELMAVVPDPGALARLRDVLATRVLALEGGHMLVVGPRELDAVAFAERVKHGRRALEAGEPVVAAEFLRAALAMWRGPAYAEVAHEPFAQDEIRRLDDLRLTALETRIEADLLLGRHGEVEAEIDALVEQHPARLRFVRHARTAKGLPQDARLDTQAPRDRACLIVRPGHRLQRVVSLDAASRLTIGRDPTADIRIGWDVRVSRVHAVLERAGDRWLLSDPGLSSNGTFCNDEPVSAPRPLRDGDVIRLGETRLAFREPRTETDDATRVEAPRVALS
jgi:hypothetical protein